MAVIEVIGVGGVGRVSSCLLKVADNAGTRNSFDPKTGAAGAAEFLSFFLMKTTR